MTNPCNDILKKGGLTKEQQDLIEVMSRQGENTPEISKKFFEALEDSEFSNSMSQISETRTNGYLDKLREIVLNDKNPYKKIFNMLVGDASGVTSKTLARVQDRAGHLASVTKLPNGDIQDLIDDEKFIYHLLQELDNWGNRGHSRTGNKLAYDMAGVIWKRQKGQVGEMNSFGAGMRWLDDYITKQWHDPFRMLASGKDGKKWVNDIYDKLDIEETTKRVLRMLADKGKKPKGKFDLKKYLASAFEHMTSKEVDEGMLSTYLQATRTFAFKDSRALMGYNAMYGHKNMAHAIFENMSMIDNHISLGELMGYGYTKKVEPDDLTKQLAQDELAEARLTGDAELIRESATKYSNLFKQDVNPVIETKKALQFLRDNGKISAMQFRRLRGALAQVSGDAHMIARPTVAKFTLGFQFWQYLVGLGKATLASTGSDIWTGALSMHFQGIKPGKGYLGMVNHLLRKTTRQIPQKERDVLFRRMGVGIEGIFESYSRSFINTPKMGLLNEMTDKMFSLNLLNWWTNSTREGAGKMMSNYFGDNLSLSFDKLNKNFKELLGEYEISASDWKILQKIGPFDETAFKTGGSKKIKYFTSDHLFDEATKRLENGEIIIKPEYEKLGLDKDKLNRLQQSVNRYFVMETRLAIPEAGAADRAWMYGDSKRGSLEDTTARLFFQFRSHQVKLIRAMIPRVRKMGVSSLMHVMPALTFGYVAISLKKMAAGKAPPAFDDPNTLTDALVHSGVAGFLGDFVAGQYGRYQHELDEVIAGSAYSTIKNWADLAIGLQTGDKNASDVWKNLRYNIPFGNLFYTEAAINYGLHYGIMETFSPGYLQRMEAREDGLNTGFMVNPSTIWSFGGLR